MMRKDCGASASAAFRAKLRLKLKDAREGKMDGIAGFYFATDRCLIRKAASPGGLLRPPTSKNGSKRKRGSERRTLRFAKRSSRRQCSKRLSARRPLCKPYLLW